MDGWDGWDRVSSIMHKEIGSWYYGRVSWYLDRGLGFRERFEVGGWGLG